MVAHVKPAGSTMEAGDLIATIALRDPSMVKKAEVFKGWADYTDIKRNDVLGLVWEKAGKEEEEEEEEVMDTSGTLFKK